MSQSSATDKLFDGFVAVKVEALSADRAFDGFAGMGVEVLGGLTGNGLNGMEERSLPILRRLIIKITIKDAAMSPPAVAPIIKPTLGPSDWIVEDFSDGTVEDIWDGVVEGLFDGICVVEGFCDGEGFCEGKFEGLWDGAVEGSIDGELDG